MPRSVRHQTRGSKRGGHASRKKKKKKRYAVEGKIVFTQGDAGDRGERALKGGVLT